MVGNLFRTSFDFDWISEGSNNHEQWKKIISFFGKDATGSETTNYLILVMQTIRTSSLKSTIFGSWVLVPSFPISGKNKNEKRNQHSLLLKNYLMISRCLRKYHLSRYLFYLLLLRPSSSAFCAAGKYSSDGTDTLSSCSSCITGTYQTSIGATSCTSCIEGYYCATTGLTSASLCASGRYSSASASSCQSCPSGCRKK